MSDQQRSRHTKFDLGMMRDIASWELPEGAVYDAVDMLCDMPGKIRKRGGTTSPAAGNSAATVENLVSYKSGNTDGLTGLWGSLGKGGVTIKSFNSSTGAVTSVLTDTGLNNSIACRPFQHNDLMVFPFSVTAPGTSSANDRNNLYFGGGGTGSSFFPTAATVTANDNRVTAVLAASFVAAHVGCIIELEGAGSQHYIGRIIEVTAANAIRVAPTPTIGFAANAGAVNAAWNAATIASSRVYTGRFGNSFQNRICLGYTTQTQTANYAKGPIVSPNRMIWSNLPTDPIGTFGGTASDGDNLLYGDWYSPYNYVDVPNLGGMTGMAAAGDGQEMLFGPRATFRISGQLATETVANNSFSFSVDQISNNIGCASAKSIQYARGGLIWASWDNIYEYDGSSLRPLLNGRNARYFQSLLNGGATIYGSAYFLNRNHYYLSMSGSQGGLCIDLDNLSQVRWTGPTTVLFDSTPDPSDATILWGARWWDTTGAAPTMTKGQLVRLDPIFAPAQTNASDADGTAVIHDVQTASYVNGPSITNTKLTSDVIIAYDHRGTGSPTSTVKMDTKLNTSDAAYVTVTSSLANTGSAATSTRLDVGNLLPDGPAIETRITGNGACASFELLSLDFGTQPRPEQFGAS